MEILFNIYLASKTRWIHLQKGIVLQTVPRVGEFIKFNNNILGNYFAWKIAQVTYLETGGIEIQTELLNNVEERNYSFEEELELDEYVDSYLREGWSNPTGVTQNTIIK